MQYVTMTRRLTYVQESKSKDTSESDFVCSCSLQLPNHGYGKRQDHDIHTDVQCSGKDV